MKYIFLVLPLTIALSCQSKAQQATQDFDASSLKPLIQELGTTWGKALQTKDISLLENLYDENAHYLPNDSQAFHGRQAIVDFWKSSLDFIGDITLSMHSLEGTEDLLYENGLGQARILGEDGAYFNLEFKYVNVWKLQDDGSYRVVIDTFNNIGPQ